jgi:hypothetical protein
MNTFRHETNVRLDAEAFEPLQLFSGHHDELYRPFWKKPAVPALGFAVTARIGCGGRAPGIEDIGTWEIA